MQSLGNLRAELAPLALAQAMHLRQRARALAIPDKLGALPVSRILGVGLLTRRVAVLAGGHHGILLSLGYFLHTLFRLVGRGGILLRVIALLAVLLLALGV